MLTAAPSSPCSSATELARAHSSASSPAGSPTPTLLLPAPHTSLGQALQKKPCPDQLPGTGFGPGDRGSSKPSRAESRGCVEAKAATCAQPSARAGEKHRDTHLSGHSSFWNAKYNSGALYGSRACVLDLQVIFEQVLQMKKIF